MSSPSFNPSSLSYRPWICICAGMLVFFIQVTALFPVLPVYVVQRWGTDATVGLVVGAMAAGLLCFRPWIGLLVDCWGRKPVLWMGLLIMLSILPLYQWSPDLIWLKGVRVLHGVSQAAFATASQTLLVDLVPPDRRAALMGYLAMSNTIGFSIGPLLGAALFATGGFSAVLLLMMGLTVLGFAISLPLPWVDDSQRSPQTHFSHTVGFPWKFVLSFPIREATLLFFIGSFLHGGVITFLPLLIPSSAQFYSLNALAAILVRFSVGRWGHQIAQRRLIGVSLLCSGIALLGLVWLPNFLVLWALLYGCGFGALFPVLSAIVSLASPLEGRGRIYSIFLAGFDAGMTLGSVGVQQLIQLISLEGLFTLLGGVGCSVGLIAFQRFNDCYLPCPVTTSATHSLNPDKPLSETPGLRFPGDRSADDSGDF